MASKGLPARRMPTGFRKTSKFNSPTPKLKGFNKGARPNGKTSIMRG